MIVAVTGGTGFIGYNLVNHLLNFASVVKVLTRSNYTAFPSNQKLQIYNFDLLTATSEDLQKFVSDVDILYHCAGQLSDQSSMRQLHVNATLRLAYAASGNIKRWVQLSSVGVYGYIADGLVDESTKISPVGEYEITKSEAEVLVERISVKHHFEYTVLRPSNVYGNGMSNQSLFQLIRSVEAGYFFYVGRAGSSANYIHVDNVVEALYLCGTIPEAAGNKYNISDCVTFENLIQIIADTLGVNPPKLRLPLWFVSFFVKLISLFYSRFPLTKSRINALVTRSVYSSHKIKCELGYKDNVTLIQGMQDLVNHWKASNGR